MSSLLSGKRVLVTGGTGSLGRALVRRLLSGELGRLASVTVFSRDEAKQHQMRLDFQHRPVATDDVRYHERGLLRFRIGDICDLASVSGALRDADVVFHAAALKQVPACEYQPFEAVKTNILGAQNIVQTIRDQGLPVETVVGVTTDKACKPVNAMGMTKALQERILAQANLELRTTRLLTARYGNVLASRGSVIPLFHAQIRDGGPVTVTTAEMTRFLLSLDDAVDTVFAALGEGRRGETYIPRAPAVNVLELAHVLVGDRDIAIEISGVRPGEKTHEILISEEEATRTVVRGAYMSVAPILPELRSADPGGEPFDGNEYSSEDLLLDRADIHDLLRRNGLRIEDAPTFY